MSDLSGTWSYPTSYPEFAQMAAEGTNTGIWLDACSIRDGPAEGVELEGDRYLEEVKDMDWRFHAAEVSCAAEKEAEKGASPGGMQNLLLDPAYQPEKTYTALSYCWGQPNDRMRHSRASRILARTGILSAIPYCALCINSYASTCAQNIAGVERGDAWSPGIQHFEVPWIEAWQNMTFLPPPSPYTFVAASLAMACLIRAHRYLSERNQYQEWIMPVILVAVFVLGAVSGLTVLSTTLYLLPWSAFLGVLISEASNVFYGTEREQGSEIEV